MTSSYSLPDSSRPYGRVLARGFGLASAVVFALAAMVWVFGFLDPNETGYLALGVFAAVGASGAAILVHGRILALRSHTGGTDGALIAGRLQGLLGLAFLIKLLVLGVVVMTMRQTGVKFEGIAVFGVTFAGSSVIGQVISAGFIARAIGRPAVAARQEAQAARQEARPSPSPESTTTPPC